MQRILIIFFLLVSFLSQSLAQTFRYIGLNDGLSSRRVISIEQGFQDYIWILTHKGVDRFDGKYFSHYRLECNDKTVHFYPNLNQLAVDNENILWEFGKEGYVFRYDEMRDTFVLVFNLHEQYPLLKNKPITSVYMDSNRVFWFCCANVLVRYDAINDNSTYTERFLDGNVSAITEGNDNQYFFATNKYIYTCYFNNDELRISEQKSIEHVRLINYIYFHKETNKLIVNTLLNGLFLYNVETKDVASLGTAFKDVGVNTIKPYYKDLYEVLIATDGDGIYKLNLKNNQLTHFLKEEYQESNKMNGSIIKDICIDKSNRIWSVIYPTGLTVYSEKYESYKWIRHNASKESLVDNRINAIIQDSDGDIWFATCNGISQYNPTTKKWKNYLSEGSKDSKNDNRIFISLCESEPGQILAGGYMSGTYHINKYTGKVDFTIQPNVTKGIYPDKYIRSIYRDKEGMLWGGGYYTLRSYDKKTKTSQLYHTAYPITCIREKDENFLWIGTINGLYTFNKTTKQLQEYPLSGETGCINAIYQEPKDSMTYVATYGNGLYFINNITKESENFRIDNSGLITNNIYSILPNKEGNFFLGTENGLAFFDARERLATHWTKEQGLLAYSFNQNAAIKTKTGNLIFGTDDGIIIIPDSLDLPRHFSSHMIFENLHIMYRIVHPNMPGSPLHKLLNETTSINLAYDQNTFSLNVNSINFDNPSNILYSWKLEGFYNVWTEPGTNNLIRYTNLSPGHYTLRVRTHLLDNNQFLEERSIKITVAPPFWMTFWAFLVYAVLISGAVYTLIRYQAFKKDRRTSEEKIKFFIQTAHDIRTPLTLIKAPLGEILQKERLSNSGVTNLNLAIQSTDNLSDLANNLINFQKEELYSSKVNVQREKLNLYVRNYLRHFESYAEQKGLQLEFKSSFNELEVWIDCNKMDSILRNLLTNALKYTPKGGRITIETDYNKKNWSIIVRDTGIGIPKQDQSKLFKFLFRGKNATNQLITGSGIGMLLTYRLIQNHQGKITFSSKENSGTSFYLTFPIKSKHYFYKDERTDNALMPEALSPQEHAIFEWSAPETHTVLPNNAPHILIVEDNTQLRLFLKKALADMYVTEEVENGAEALEAIKQKQPDLIISDVMMPVMDGHTFCKQVKSNMETSHIPVILLTALGDKEDILNGLESRADRYIVKPFDLMVLKANISNILENRNMLRERLQKTITANLKPDGPSSEIENTIGLLSSLDDEFIQQVTQHVKDGLGKGLNVDTLCMAMRMSRTSFYNKIKGLTGLAPAELIRNIRMEEAATLLRSHRHSVSEVSQMLGFADPKYFTDLFKKCYGMTPSMYVKQEMQKLEKEKEKQKQEPSDE